MKRIAGIRMRWLQYMMDVFFIVLTTVWIYAPFNKSVMLPLLAVMVIGGIICEFLFTRMKITVGKVVLVLPFLWGMGWLLGLDLLLFLLAGVLCLWRFTSHYLDPDLGQEMFLFMLTIMSVGTFFFLYNNSEYLLVVLSITMIQVLLMSSIRVNRTLGEQQLHPTIKKWVAYIFLGFVGTTGIVALFFPLIKQIFMLGMRALGTAVGLVLYYPAQYILNWFMSLVDPSELESSGEQEGKAKPDKKFLDQDFTNSGIVDFLNAFLIIVALLLVIWIVWKFYNKQLTLQKPMTLTPVVESQDLSYEEPNLSFRNKRRAPENRIRKRLFQLESKMAKYNYGRYSNESVHEWLSRVEPPEELHQQITSIYQQVRYGELDVTQEQTTKYEAAIQKLLSWGKLNYKNKENLANAKPWRWR
ncbi:DUF4129 domain-containing protein [Pseudalkalibacillus decolorationis]|uniref:DUF4129 domain-containing protein n=1 Tax=Pseudalkalibacillus decolorationis TaxID=163879 RepID=UPI002147F6DD|nr:DUF4129 domain-containing protein [Pseudalkalibacillus decolorationis]